MLSKYRLYLSGAAVCALIFANASSLHASTIIKLNLGNAGPDLSMNAVGVLGTASDGDVGTTGDQNTNIEYTSFLDPIPDINASIASFTLSGLTASGPPQLFGSLAFQNFSGGTFSLYDSSNLLLLSGLLTTSNLQGTVGSPGTGAVFSTGVASVTGGVLSDQIETNSLGLSMTLSNVNGGTGLSLSLIDGSLNGFLADTVVSILGDPSTPGGGLPEPGTLVLATLALFSASVVRRRSQ
jgi:hypothetical protein